MARKPTYEELEQRVKELEKGDVNCKTVEEPLQESEKHDRQLLKDLDKESMKMRNEGKNLS